MDESVTVKATVKGKPHRVRWLFEGEEVSADTGLKTEAEGAEHKIIISKAAHQHTGRYTLEVENDAGTKDKKDITITVQGNI